MANVVLTNVEFIALKMQAHPGRSGRFYRRACLAYKQPRLAASLARDPKACGSDHYSFYFRKNSRYRDRLWVDEAEKTVKDHMVSAWSSRRSRMDKNMKPKRSEWRLTEEGQRVADRAREKLGLPKLAKLSPSDEASQRTKNRIREHGPDFKVERIEGAACFNGEEAALVRSEDGWFGWLPLDEVKFVN
jgi:hypothetical protein